MLREHHAEWWSSLFKLCPPYLSTAAYYIIPPLTHQMASPRHSYACPTQWRQTNLPCAHPGPHLRPGSPHRVDSWVRLVFHRRIALDEGPPRPFTHSGSRRESHRQQRTSADARCMAVRGTSCIVFSWSPDHRQRHKHLKFEELCASLGVVRSQEDSEEKNHSSFVYRAHR